MIENNPNSKSLNPINIGVGSRSSAQSLINFIPKLYKNGASIIIEYSDGVIIHDCEWAKIDGCGRNGSTSFLPLEIIVLTWKNADSLSFEVEYIKLKDIKKEVVLFKDILGAVYFDYKIIKHLQNEKHSLETIGAILAETYYINQQK